MQGVDQPHFGVRVAVQGLQGVVQPSGAAVVQQQAHAHAAVGGQQQLVQQQQAGLVVAPDVVLHIQRVLGGAGQQAAGGEGFARIAQGVDARVRVRGLRLLPQGRMGLSLGRLREHVRSNDLRGLGRLDGGG